MKAIVVSFDRLHLGFLGCYGNPWIQTPHFNRLAAESIVFDQFFAGAIGNEAGEDVLRDAGIAVRVLCDGSQQVSENVSSGDVSSCEDIWSSAARSLGEQADSTVLWIQAAGPSLEMAPENAEEAQPNYEAMLDYLSSFAPQDDFSIARMADWADYARQVTRLDAQLGDFLMAIDRVTGDDPPLLIVTATAGEVVLAAGHDDDQDMEPHEEVVHCPLLIRVPGSSQAGSRRRGLATTADISATLATWFSDSATADYSQGHTLQSLLNSTGDELREHVFFGGAEDWWAVRTEEFLLKSCRSHPSQLFIKPDDRFDQADVAAQYPGVVDELEQAWQQFQAASPGE